MSVDHSYYAANLDKIVTAPESSDSLEIYSVCVEPTNRCTGKCPYCLIENHQKDPTFEVLIGNIDQLAKFGVLRIGWGGGEPLLRRDIYELGEYARAWGMGSLLRTSGMFPIDLKQAKRAFDWIDISFDSHEREIFTRIRPGVDFDVLVTNIQSLIGTKQRIRVSILLTQLNLHTLTDTIDWLSNVGVKQIRLQSLVRRGSAVRNWDALYVEECSAKEQLLAAVAHANAIGIEAYEMKSISQTTLVIMKPNGTLYTGNPTGQLPVGHVSKRSTFVFLRSVVGSRQTENYVGS